MYLVGELQTGQCWLVEVSCADNGDCTQGTLQGHMQCLCCSTRARELQAGRDCLQFLGAGSSMECLERRHCNSNMAILLFPKELLHNGCTTVRAALCFSWVKIQGGTILLQASRFLGSSKDIPKSGTVQCHRANQSCNYWSHF